MVSATSSSIGDSGPNQPGQIAVAATLNPEWAGGTTGVHAIPGYYRSDPEGGAAIIMTCGIKREQIGNHADTRDTSQMMAVDPTMVRVLAAKASERCQPARRIERRALWGLASARVRSRRATAAGSFTGTNRSEG